MMQHVAAIFISTCLHQGLRQRQVRTHLLTLGLLPIQIDKLLYRTRQLHLRVRLLDVRNSLRLRSRRLAINTDAAVSLRQLRTQEIILAVTLCQQRFCRRRFNHALRLNRLRHITHHARLRRNNSSLLAHSNRGMLLLLCFLGSLLRLLLRLLLSLLQNLLVQHLRLRIIIGILRHRSTAHSSLHSQQRSKTKNTKFFIKHYTLLLFYISINFTYLQEKCKVFPKKFTIRRLHFTV